MPAGSTRITKAEWQRLGGLRNPLLWRRQVGSRWQHYRRND